MAHNACPCVVHHPFKESGIYGTLVPLSKVLVSNCADDPDVRILNPQNVSVITNTA